MRKMDRIMGIIKADKLSYDYIQYVGEDEEEQIVYRAVSDVSVLFPRRTPRKIQKGKGFNARRLSPRRQTH